MPTIHRLADRPDLVPVLADTLRVEWSDWYGARPREQVVAEVASWAQTDAIPLGLAALEGASLAGTVSLTAGSIQSHLHLTPWLTGLWVEAGYRRKGTGAALVAACRDEAERLGFERIYAATASARALFRRDGWSRIDTVELPAHPGEQIDVFRFDLV